MNVAGILGNVLAIPDWVYNAVPVQPDAITPNPSWNVPSAGVSISIVGTTQGTYQEPWPQD